MRAGRLRTRLKLQSESTAIELDSAGGEVENWQTDATLYAEPLDTSASEPGEGQVERAHMERTWRIRYREGVTSHHRLVEEGSTDRVWTITGPPYDPTGRREELRVESRSVGL